MDPLLSQFYRQYLQQVNNLTYPPSKLLVHPDIQDQIYRYLFDDDDTDNSRHLSPLPPPEYQRRVLKKLLEQIERELTSRKRQNDSTATDDNDVEGEDEISDALMTHMGHLSSLPQKPNLESAQEPRILSYFLPDHPDTITEKSRGHDRILIKETPQLLASGSNVGLRTWEACLRLGWYLCTSPERGKVRGVTVLELGAGTGLLSLICSLGLGARRVVSTDGLGHVVEGIRENVRINAEQSGENHGGGGGDEEGGGGGGGGGGAGGAGGKRKMPAARVLDWTDLTDLDEVLTFERKLSGEERECEDDDGFDYVLGADITYHPDLLGPLASLLAVLKQKFPSCRILIGATVRNERTFELWNQACRECGLVVREVGEVDGGEWKCPEYRDQTGLFHEQAFPVVIMDIDVVV